LESAVKKSLQTVAASGIQENYAASQNLTEDAVLRDFLAYLIDKHCASPFYQFKIIYVGGGTNTTDLMQRNKIENFFTDEYKNVIVVLDRDQREKAHVKSENVYCIPMESVEKELLARCLSGELGDTKKFQELVPDHVRLSDFMNGTRTIKRNLLKIAFYELLLRINKKSTKLRIKLSAAQGQAVKERDFSNAGKRLFRHLIKNEYKQEQIFEFLIEKRLADISSLRAIIEEFLSARGGLLKKR
jgi:hypothetical protein